MTHLRTLGYQFATVIVSDDCHKRGYVHSGIHDPAKGWEPRRAVEWDEHGFCRANFFDSLIGIDRWSRIPLQKREEITNYAKEGRHDLAIHEFEEAEYDRGRGAWFRGAYYAMLGATILWILILGIPFILTA